MSELLVSAASSLTEVLTELGVAFERENPGVRVRFNFASSGTLLQQIRQGAPVDAFVSASPKEMDALAKEGRLTARTRRNVAGNRLVLIAPTGSKLRRWEDLGAPEVKRIALSQPDSVPSGRYAKKTLTRRKLWDSVSRKAIFGQNVRQTLAYVSGGNVDAGVVFATDVLREKRVRVVAAATSGKDHEPIVYPAAAIRESKSAGLAGKFVAFLVGRRAKAAFARCRFVQGAFAIAIVRLLEHKLTESDNQRIVIPVVSRSGLVFQRRVQPGF